MKGILSGLYVPGLKELLETAPGEAAVLSGVTPALSAAVACLAAERGKRVLLIRRRGRVPARGRTGPDAGGGKPGEQLAPAGGALGGRGRRDARPVRRGGGPDAAHGPAGAVQSPGPAPEAGGRVPAGGPGEAPQRHGIRPGGDGRGQGPVRPSASGAWKRRTKLC